MMFWGLAAGCALLGAAASLEFRHWAATELRRGGTPRLPWRGFLCAATALALMMGAYLER
jgi:hypothetical protein